MVFGEIIEPSTRALVIEDEHLENIPLYIGPIYQWEGQAQVPDDLETLIVVESKRAIYIASFLIKEKQPVCSIRNEGVSIYKVDKNYIVLFLNQTKSLILGEIAEILSPWLKKAKSIQAITTEPISSLKPTEMYKDMVTITKYTQLSARPWSFNFIILYSPQYKSCFMDCIY
ncbi:hypothetical protein GWI33_018184 [Rhynchophorus ferrugineus]|uniref:Proteasome assembly chaperone 1 n=1 Tax=Rhynchophorus ferrugineus TaxID=354439 RepID=A0A834I0X7_RHYFE|nr:hypothetical protein GWI33_018184 [Rhynchophorus ferrugineus]